MKESVQRPNCSGSQIVMDDRGSKVRRTNFTLSIDNEILKEVRMEAEKRNLSNNAFATDIIKTWVSFYRYVEELECTPIPREIFQLMLDAADEKQMAGWLGKAVNEVWPSVMIHESIPKNIKDYVQYAYGYIGKKAAVYSSFKLQEESSENLVLIFQHKYGIKWSRILAEVFSNALKNSFDVQVEREVLPSTLILRVK